MKIDRLYALTLYLLNHGKSSASGLAKHFEVSVRTIQRDIDALCQAGVPICAFTGTNGGYEILSDFKMNNQLASKDEYAYIATAINGLKTVTNNPVADDIYEKITAISTIVRMRCWGNAIHRIKEYLNGQLIETCDDGSSIMDIHIVENEQWWIGVVLSQGKEVEVIEPEHIKERIMNSAKDILFLYEKL